MPFIFEFRGPFLRKKSLSVGIYTYIHMHTSLYYTPIHFSVNIYICVYIYMHTFTSAVSLYIFAQYINIYVYLYICIYTHIHTRTQKENFYLEIKAYLNSTN